MRNCDQFKDDIAAILKPHVGQLLDEARIGEIEKSLRTHPYVGIRVNPRDFLEEYKDQELTSKIAEGISREVSWTVSKL